jgi:hypothetical protein
MPLRKVSLSPTYAHPSPLPFPMNLKIDIDNQGFACAPTPQQRGVESICQLRMADQATGRLTYAPPSRLPQTRARSFARPDRAFGCAEFLSLHSQATTVSPLRGEGTAIERFHQVQAFNEQTTVSGNSLRAESEKGCDDCIRFGGAMRVQGWSGENLFELGERRECGMVY